MNRLERDFAAAKASVAYTQHRMVTRENNRRRNEEFKVGDKVLLSVSRKKQLLLHIPGHLMHGKLGPKWIGPLSSHSVSLLWLIGYNCLLASLFI